MNKLKIVESNLISISKTTEEIVSAEELRNRKKFIESEIEILNNRYQEELNKLNIELSQFNNFIDENKAVLADEKVEVLEDVKPQR